ncbi:MAG TPA: hypothetical protein VFI11_09585 [Anaerolineales bacterium]|nr:hypothetical protein [Anaerolineales bacterium]
MTPTTVDGTTPVEDTQPTRARRKPSANRGGSPRSAWIGTVLVSLTVLAVAGLLILPPLLASTPGWGPAYDVLALSETRATMAPGDDTLLVTPDGIVAVYVPIGAYPQAGDLVVKSRDLALMPQRAEDEFERFYPVDVFIEENGTTLDGAAFVSPILLCYLLEPSLQAVVAVNAESVRIQSYLEDDSSRGWSTLAGAPGWMESQICSNVDHLSLFALAIHRSVLVGGVGPKESRTTMPPDLPPYVLPSVP